MMKTYTIDEIYDLIGHLGFAQKIYAFSLGILQFFICHHMLLNIFIGLDPSFICISKTASISGEFEYLENKCFNNTPENCNFKYNNAFTSIATEWNLVCNQKYKVGAVQSLWMGGVMAGALFLGSLPDCIGRMKSLMFSIIGTVAFEAFSAFASSYEFFALLRFFGGMCCSMLIIVSFVLSQEIVGATRRSLVGIGTGIFFSFGIVSLAYMASYLTLWRDLSLIASIIGLTFLFIPFAIPESPRWLVSQGKYEKAKEVLETIARINGTSNCLPNNWSCAEVSLKNHYRANKKFMAVALFSHPYIFMLTIIQIYSWFVNSAVYYALTMAAGTVKGNVYIATALNGLVEIPAAIASILIIDRLGRRTTLCGFMLLGGSTCLLVPIIASAFPRLVNILFLVGKLCISASFGVIYVHSGEIFPTMIRNTGIGVVSVAARFGGITAPFILMLDDIYPNFHFGILGILTILAGFCNMKLPETLGCKVPETVEDIVSLNCIILKPITKKGVYSTLAQEENDELNAEVEIYKKYDQCPLIPHGKM